MNLPEFVRWFSEDLMYKPPEDWRNHLRWFLGELVGRYGNVPDRSREPFDPRAAQVLGPVGYAAAVDLCRRVHEAEAAVDGGSTMAARYLDELRALLGPTLPAVPATAADGAAP